MRYNICSISFRHVLASFGDLIRFAHRAGFSGIELWGVHAYSMVRDHPPGVIRILREMESVGIGVSMISDYLDLLANADRFVDVERKWKELISLARLFKTDKIRIFAGDKASAAAVGQEWERCAARLARLADLSSVFGIYTVIETHPGTLADNLDATLKLIDRTDHDFLRVNLDFLHLVEAGCRPLDVLAKLKPWTINYHLKNVSARDRLHVFSPGNVYSPSGLRDGMTPLADGIVDFAEIMDALVRDRTPCSASLEWFGNEPFRVLQAELQWLRKFENRNDPLFERAL